MAFDALGAVVMISGPGDTMEEVAAVRDAIAKWNSDHAVDQEVVFIPRHFSTDAVPVYAADVDGQFVINQQMTMNSDVVLCLFKDRLGTATDRNEHSGTVEEADLRVGTERVHMLFSGEAPSVEVWRDQKAREQRIRVDEFREQLEKAHKGLYGTFHSLDELKDMVTRALSRDAKLLRAERAAGQSVVEPFATFELEIDGDVWSGREIVKDLITGQISLDAYEYNQRKSSDPDQREFTDQEYLQWSKKMMSGIDWFVPHVAAAVMGPLTITLASSTPLEGVEVEIVFRGVRGLNPSGRSWYDIWRPFTFGRQEGPHVFRHPSRVVPPDQRWVEHGGDVVVTLDVGRLRRRSVPDVLHPAILMVPGVADGREEIEYSWRATASNVDDELEGKGTLPVMSRAQTEAVIALWTH
jgi:hypothetical protein